MAAGALLVCGATSGAGKSTVTAGLCRWLARAGKHVAPFKAQNMSNHSAVSVDGGEVGRAQAMQALAAGVDLETAMNPVLLKPTTNGQSHVVVDGREVGRTDAGDWGRRTTDLRATVSEALATLRSRHDVVIAEGAGGAAEINLLDRDLVNLPLARATGMRALLVVDIERGGAFAAAFGTIGLLPPELATTIGGIVFNQFRGDPALLDLGIAELEARTGVPVLGVLPHLEATQLGVEDSLDIGAVRPVVAPRSANPVRVVAVRVPHLANPSDLDPFLIEPDVSFSWAVRPADLEGADLIVLPGSRATVADLDWLVQVGLADALATTTADIVGICAGQQMLGHRIHDDVESGRGTVPGLGLLPIETVFGHEKVVARRTGRAAGHRVHGYQLHLGRTRPLTGTDIESWLELDPMVDAGDAAGGRRRSEPDGACGATGRVRGTSLHSVFDADAFRAALLRDVADRHHRTFGPAVVGLDEHLRIQHDRLADWLDEHLDMPAVCRLIGEAAPRGPGW